MCSSVVRLDEQRGYSSRILIFTTEEIVMYCPACGTQSHETQKFCRSCGMVLKTISEAVEEHLASIADSSLTGTTSLKKKLVKKSERTGELMSMVGFLLLIVFLSVFFVGIGLSKVVGFSLAGFDLVVPLVMSVALPLIFIGSGLKLYPMVSKRLSGPNREHPSALSQAETTHELINDRGIGLMPSVTERTTRTLEHSTNKTSGAPN